MEMAKLWVGFYSLSVTFFCFKRRFRSLPKKNPKYITLSLSNYSKKKPPITACVYIELDQRARFQTKVRVRRKLGVAMGYERGKNNNTTDNDPTKKYNLLTTLTCPSQT